MMHIKKDVLNNVYVTIQEKRVNTSNYYYLMAFQYDTTDDIIYHKVTNVQDTDRISTIRFTEGSGSGEVNLRHTGHWHYTIYEDTDATNTDPSAVSVIKVLETGKALVTGIASDAVSYTQRPQSTNNKVYIQI